MDLPNYTRYVTPYHLFIQCILLEVVTKGNSEMGEQANIS